MTDTTSKKRRRTLTPGERQQERFDAAKARLKRAHDASTKADANAKAATTAKADADAEVKAAEKALEYETNHPDLPRTIVTDKASGGSIAAGGAS